EDEAPASLLPPGFLSPRIRPLSPKALEAETNAIASSLYHSLHPSGKPPLLHIPLSTPSTSHRAEGIQTREALAKSETYCRALEARVAVLETHVRRLEWQCEAADDFAVQHIMRTQALEAGARDDTLE
nr:hypothetical protein [Tanacetum cinerariifolium]